MGRDAGDLMQVIWMLDNKRAYTTWQQVTNHLPHLPDVSGVNNRVFRIGGLQHSEQGDTGEQTVPVVHLPAKGS